VSVIEIKRYRAKCHCCGGLGDLRDDEKSALAYVMEKSGWRYVLHEDGGEKLLCDICQKEREGLDAATKMQLQATSVRALAAKAAAWDRFHRTDLEMEALAEERARRGLA
jgi:hypothetical protein